MKTLIEVDPEILNEILEPVPPCSINEIFQNVDEGKLNRDVLNKYAQTIGDFDITQE